MVLRSSRAAYAFHPAFQSRLNMILIDLANLGWKPRLHRQAVRTRDEQARIVAAGNSKTMNSWHVRSTQATLPHGRTELDIVYGNAADIIDERHGWSGPAADTKFKFWQDLGRVAKKYGCSWGGDWKRFPDVAHIEFLYIDTPPRNSVVV